MSRCMLSTIDNPFNPFEDFKDWLMYDSEKGYYSCGYVGRISRTSDLLTDEENDLEIERAIDEIIKYDFTNLYIKVKEDENKKQVDRGGVFKTTPPY